MSISILILDLWQFFNKELTRNPEIWNTPVWVLSNIWRLGQVGDTKFGMNIFNKKLLDAAKCQVYSLITISELLRKDGRGSSELRDINTLY